MVWNLDARIPVLSLPDAAGLRQALRAGPSAALLLPEGAPDIGGAVATARFQPFASHAVACACCGGRSPWPRRWTACSWNGCAAPAPGLSACWR
ncbi:hypothetical protein NF552_14920 [Roseomonas mucosa]|nr:hypothetical protein NF552_14920 [Roseomonas mucosa]